jgi:hypothetical protein
VAAIVGEPGVGKSRLTFELTHSHRVEGWLVLEAGASSHGKADALANRPAEAIPLLRKVADQSASMKLVSDHLLGAIPLGDVWLSTGRMAARRDPSDVGEAVAHYRGAIGLAHELGMRPLAAHCHLGLGSLYRRTGQRQEAQEHLVIAATMCREMDMRFWLEKADAEIRVLG